MNFAQNANTLHALENSHLIGILCRFLCLSDLHLVETKSKNFGPEGAPKSQNTLLLLAITHKALTLIFQPLNY